MYYSELFYVLGLVLDSLQFLYYTEKLVTDALSAITILSDEDKTVSSEPITKLCFPLKLGLQWKCCGVSEYVSMEPDQDHTT